MNFRSIFLFFVLVCSLAFANDIEHEPKHTQPRFSVLDLTCLSKAIHHEAGGESMKGKIAVGHVVINRTNDPRFPNTICDVVKQKTKSLCQFSWVCVPGTWNKQHSKESENVAYSLLTERKKDPTRGALFFHSASIDQRFNRKQTVIIGNHIFYK